MELEKRADERAVEVDRSQKEEELCHVGPSFQDPKEQSRQTFSSPIVRPRIVRWLVRRPVVSKPGCPILVSSTPHCLTKMKATTTRDDEVGWKKGGRTSLLWRAADDANVTELAANDDEVE
jgi:hypothetical protein